MPSLRDSHTIGLVTHLGLASQASACRRFATILRLALQANSATSKFTRPVERNSLTDHPAQTWATVQILVASHLTIRSAAEYPLSFTCHSQTGDLQTKPS